MEEFNVNNNFETEDSKVALDLHNQEKDEVKLLEKLNENEMEEAFLLLNYRDITKRMIQKNKGNIRVEFTLQVSRDSKELFRGARQHFRVYLSKIPRDLILREETLSEMKIENNTISAEDQCGDTCLPKFEFTIAMKDLKRSEISVEFQIFIREEGRDLPIINIRERLIVKGESLKLELLDSSSSQVLEKDGQNLSGSSLAGDISDDEQHEIYYLREYLQGLQIQLNRARRKLDSMDKSTADVKSSGQPTENDENENIGIGNEEEVGTTPNT